jgi:hypothetical protein
VTYGTEGTQQLDEAREDNTPSAAQLMDLNMLAMPPGKERTAQEYGALLSSADLRVLELLPTHSPLQVVVAEK